MTDEMEAYPRGFEDRRNGVNRNDCPYEPNSKDAKDWTSGWNEENDNIHREREVQIDNKAMRNTFIAFFALLVLHGMTGWYPVDGNGLEKLGAMVVIGLVCWATYTYTKSYPR